MNQQNVALTEIFKTALKNQERGDTPPINYYSVYDAVGNKFWEAFIAPDDVTAVRNIIISLRKNEQMQMFKNDLSLWHVGSFSPDLGKFLTVTPRKLFALSAYSEASENMS